MKLSFSVPLNAKPGEAYVIHLAEKLDGQVVAGITHVLHVARRK